MSWTAEQIELLKTLAADKMLARQIAERIGGGITRSAVISKCNRDHIKLSGQRCSYAPAPAPPAHLPAPHEAKMPAYPATTSARHGLPGVVRRYVTTKPVTLPKLNLPDLVD